MTPEELKASKRERYLTNKEKYNKAKKHAYYLANKEKFNKAYTPDNPIVPTTPFKPDDTHILHVYTTLNELADIGYLRVEDREVLVKTVNGVLKWSEEYDARLEKKSAAEGIKRSAASK